MKSCTRCSNMLTADATYCHVCNSPQTAGFEEFELKAKPNSAFLIVLCILTIIGCIFGLIGIPINYKTAMSSPIDMDYPSVWFLAIAGLITLGKLAGAILMLMKKLTGLYIYTVAALGSIVSLIYSMFTVTYPEGTEDFMNVVMIMSMFFAILFIVLYWLPVSRKVLS